MSRYHKSSTRQLRQAAVSSLVVLVSAFLTTRAQTFNSGSTGADGAFAPTQSVTIQVPESGVFNYTTVTIPFGVVVTYTPNSKNTPVTILASGDVRISGILSVNGNKGNGIYGGTGGPGGFRGGNGGSWLNDPAGKPGEGPGGGLGGPAVSNGTDANGGSGGGYYSEGGSGRQGGPSPAPGGKTYGSKTLLPLLGGSGGGGASASRDETGGSGGGGGGAILIASSTRIIFEGTWAERGVYAVGGQAGCTRSICGGGGSGGAVRLVANAISGSGRLFASGGDAGGSRGNFGGLGYVRCEAYDLTQLTADFGGGANFSFARPNPVTLANNPQLRILSVGGINAPAQPGGSFYTAQPDIVVPDSTANPVNIVIQATNLSATATVQVTRVAETGDRVTATCMLSGTKVSSTCTAQVSLPPSKICVITVTATVDGLIVLNQPTFIEGERVEKVEVAASFGGSSQVTYITRSGRRLTLSQ